MGGVDAQDAVQLGVVVLAGVRGAGVTVVVSVDATAADEAGKIVVEGAVAEAIVVVGAADTVLSSTVPGAVVAAEELTLGCGREVLLTPPAGRRAGRRNGSRPPSEEGVQKMVKGRQLRAPFPPD